ncbi:MAG: CHAT domain-containing protein [Maribacter sp.]
MRNFLVLFFLSFVFAGEAQQNLSYDEIDSLNTKGSQFIYVHKDSAYHFFDKAYLASKKNNNQELLTKTILNFVGTASYHHDLKKMEVSLRELETILGILKNSNRPVTDENIYLVAYYKGIYEYLISKNRNAIQTFENIISNIKKIPDSLRTDDLKSMFSGSYSFIGKLYVEQEKYDLAKKLYNNAIRTILEKEPENLENLYGNYNLLGEVYTKQQRYIEANQYFQKTYQYSKRVGHINTMISTSFYLSENYTKLKNQDSAFFYLNEAKIAFNDNPVFYPKYHKTKSTILKSAEKYDDALNELEISLLEIEKRFDEEKNIDNAIVQNEIGAIHEILNQNNAALTNYNLALKSFDQDFKNDVKIINVLKNKARLLNRFKTKESYLKSLETVERASQIIDIIKPTFKSVTDKLVLVEDAFPLFESGMKASFQLFESTRQNKYLNLAFNYSEKGKSILLLEALLGAKATEFANIPNNLLERELQLKSEITFIEKQLNQSQKSNPKQENALFAFQEEYRQLIETIETDYKTYYDLKYNTKTPSIAAIQKLLAEDEKFISYFYGNDAIYAIGIAKNSKQLKRISIDASLENTIKEVHQLLGNSKSDISTLSKSSFQIFNTLVAPFLISEAHQKLIIVGDGLLNYIPFGALSTSEENPEYLMEKYAISYANSATLYEQLLDRNTIEGDLLAFAPSFNGEQVQIDPSRDSLLPLPHNKREVEQILTSFEGRSFVDENASLQNFTSELSNFSMLHLATHAVFDDTSPEYSYLAFANDEEKENMLYVSDLYNLQIQADLVTLSACETGIGELKRGEGFLSLARGFFYSGASSIASTLWKVNDASATTLMDSFYKNLSDGNTKDIALQKAKQQFLKTNSQNGLAHPYYWSGFIISGNTSAVVETNYFIWIVLASLTLILFGFLVFRKKRIH